MMLGDYSNAFRRTFAGCGAILQVREKVLLLERAVEPAEVEQEEVARAHLLDRDEIDLERIAFPSLRRAMAFFIQKTQR